MPKNLKTLILTYYQYKNNYCSNIENDDYDDDVRDIYFLKDFMNLLQGLEEIIIDYKNKYNNVKELLKSIKN